MITRAELIEKYREFFVSNGHKWIPGASLVPENDPTVLFTTAGMHPLVPHLMGESHPEGKRLANVQKCIRTGDIEEVGDAIHHTFFEMLGFWSLGDYSKETSIPYTWELFTNIFGIEKDRLAVSVFMGDEDAPFDEESYNKWLKLGVSKERIAKLPKSENWWGPAGITGPCGPDTEIFYWIGDDAPPVKFDPENKLWSEIGNNVFMQYNKTAEGKYEVLKQQNVDTGIGLARVLAILNGFDDNYQTELYKPIIDKIEQISGKKYVENKKEFRIIADHLTAAVFAIADGVKPTRKEAGSIVSKLIRVSASKIQQLSGKLELNNIVDVIAEIYCDQKNIVTNISEIREEINSGLKKFSDVINNLLRIEEEEQKHINLVSMKDFKVIATRDKFGKKIWDPWHFLNVANKILNGDFEQDEHGGDLTLIGNLSNYMIYNGEYASESNQLFDYISKHYLSEITRVLAGDKIDNSFADVVKNASMATEGAVADFLFDLKQTYGADEDLLYMLFSKNGLDKRNPKLVDRLIEKFHDRVVEHQKLSRTASAGMFKGGLADAGEVTTKYHTATHLLQEALREVLGEHVSQKGSNITPERTRFDFAHPEKMTEDQIKKVEDLVNGWIKDNLPVKMEEMTVVEAKNSGAMGVFDDKYGSKVKVYSIGNISKEICGGPHVAHTGEIGGIKITKEEASSAGVRRIKAVLV